MWHDPSTNTLIYETRDYARITSAVPTAKHIYNNHVAVPINLFNLQMMRWLGYPVTPPMTTNYAWPRSRKLDVRMPVLRAQILTANFLALHPRALTLSDPRTGKTLSLLWAADFLMSQYPPGTFRFMVVAPLSTLQRVWADAIAVHLMNRRSFAILHGSADKRRKLLAEPHDFYIINPDGIGTGARIIQVNKRKAVERRGFAADLAERKDIKGTIIDEISAYRNSMTDRHILMRAYLEDHNTVLWGASGTPTPNAPTDAYGIAKLVNNAQGETFTHFKQRTMFRLSQFKWVPMRGSAQAAREMLTPAIRFTQTDVGLNLGSDIDVREIELSATQVKHMKELRAQAYTLMEDGTKLAPANEAVLRAKLIQIACGAVYSGNGKDRKSTRLECGPRLQALRDLLLEYGCKVLIFAPLTSVVSMLYSELKEKYKEIAMVTGSTTTKHRGEYFSRFQEEEGFGPLVCDPGTVSHGLDLSASRVTCWFGPTDRTETYQQANERVRGANQKAASTTIVQFVSTPTEREIFKRIETNQNLQGVMLTLVKEGGYAVHQH